jgi:hypothetical protein
MPHLLADRRGHLARNLHAQRQQLRGELCLGDSIGFVVYQIKPDGTLEGVGVVELLRRPGSV